MNPLYFLAPDGRAECHCESIEGSFLKEGGGIMQYKRIRKNVELQRKGRKFNKITLAAMEEGRRIAYDDSVKGYTRIAGLKTALEL